MITINIEVNCEAHFFVELDYDSKNVRQEGGGEVVFDPDGECSAHFIHFVT